MGRERNDHGRYNDRIPPDAVLDVFDEREDLARPLTAADIVDDLDIARRTAHDKLNALVERGVLETRKIGARGRVWWLPLPQDTRSSHGGESGRERAETPSGARGDPSDGSHPATPRSTDARTESTDTDARSRARDALDALNRPGSGQDYDRRLGAVMQMFDHLRASPGERFGKQDFRELLAGEDVGYAGGFASLWNNWVLPNSDVGRDQNALAELPGVERRGDDYVYDPAHAGDS